MNLQKLAMYGTLMAGLSGLGCKDDTPEPEVEELVNQPTYNFRIPYIQSYDLLATTSGDIDGDGDLDLIVTRTKYDGNELHILIFKNDGLGNYQLVPLAQPTYPVERTENYEGSSLDIRVIPSERPCPRGSVCSTPLVRWGEN